MFLKTIKLLTQNLKKRSLTEKIRPVMSVLPSHAGIMPVTEKKPAYYRLTSQVLLHPLFRSCCRCVVFLVGRLIKKNYIQN